MKNILTVLLLAVALPVAAAQEPKKPADFKGMATMCNGRYALCIKALCAKTPDSQGLYPCECVMEDGWNMGPNTCEERAASLTSTYSNKFNQGSATISCPSNTPWAWCYGAQCERDPNDPNKAICKCPMLTKPTVILVDATKCGDSQQICSQLWSGALPGESQFANDYYYWWMQSHGYPAELPAPACPEPRVKMKKK